MVSFIFLVVLYNDNIITVYFFYPTEIIIIVMYLTKHKNILGCLTCKSRGCRRNYRPTVSNNILERMSAESRNDADLFSGWLWPSTTKMRSQRDW